MTWDKLAKITWWLATAAVVSYCLLSFFFWNLIDIVTPFVAPILWLPVWAIALSAIVAAITLLIQYRRTHPIASLAPVLFLIVSFSITHFIDFTGLWLAANFKLHRDTRNQIVKRIASGELTPNVSHNASLIALPPELARASLGGGEVVIQRDGDNLKILFFTFRGVLDSFAGFVYTSDGLAPKNGDFYGQFFIVRKIQDRWYYVSAH